MASQILSDEIKEANKELHDIEAKYYDTYHGEIWNFYEQLKTRQDLQKIVELVIKKPLNVLDVGAGTGNLTFKFLENGNIVTAVDISKEMLKIIYSKTPTNFKDNIKRVCSDVDGFLLKTKQKYHVISFSSVLHHLPDYFYTLNLAISKLEDEGVIYITHEPLPRLNKKGVIHHNVRIVLGLIDSFFYWLHLTKYSKSKLPNLDYSDVDVHTKEGINPKEILEFLKRKNMRVVSYKEYVVYKNGIVSILGNFLTDPRHFKLIAKGGSI